MERGGKREQLLDAALELFAERGYDATSVQEIVDAVGVGKPTLYHYFGSKRGLLEAVLAEKSAPLLARLRDATEYRRNLPVVLDRVVQAYLDFAVANPRFFRFVLSLLFAPPGNEAYEPAARVLREQQELLEAMFQAAAQQHGNMRGRHERYARSLFGVLSSYATLVLNGQLEPTPQLRREIVQQFSHGIYS